MSAAAPGVTPPSAGPPPGTQRRAAPFHDESSVTDTVDVVDDEDSYLEPWESVNHDDEPSISLAQVSTSHNASYASAELSVSANDRTTSSTSAAPREKKESKRRNIYRKLLMCNTAFRKHGRRGKPKFKYFACTKQGYLHWNETKMDLSKELPSSSYVDLWCLESVCSGKTTDVFQRRTARHSADAMCFSLITAARSIDLEAQNPTVRDQWVAALKYIIQISAKDRARATSKRFDRFFSRGKLHRVVPPNRRAVPLQIAPSDKELTEVIKFLDRGEVLLKYSRKGKPKRKWLNCGKGKLFWAAPDSFGTQADEITDTCISLDKVTEIRKGKTTDTFKKHGGGPEDLCFSLITKDRTLDLECPTEHSCQKWLRALTVATQRAKLAAQRSFIRRQRVQSLSRTYSAPSIAATRPSLPSTWSMSPAGHSPLRATESTSVSTPSGNGPFAAREDEEAKCASGPAKGAGLAHSRSSPLPRSRVVRQTTPQQLPLAVPLESQDHPGSVRFAMISGGHRRPQSDGASLAHARRQRQRQQSGTGSPSTSVADDKSNDTSPVVASVHLLQRPAPSPHQAFSDPEEFMVEPRDSIVPLSLHDRNERSLNAATADAKVHREDSDSPPPPPPEHDEDVPPPPPPPPVVDDATVEQQAIKQALLNRQRRQTLLSQLVDDPPSPSWSDAKKLVKELLPDDASKEERAQEYQAAKGRLQAANSNGTFPPSARAVAQGTPLKLIHKVTGSAEEGVQGVQGGGAPVLTAVSVGQGYIVLERKLARSGAARNAPLSGMCIGRLRLWSHFCFPFAPCAVYTGAELAARDRLLRLHRLTGSSDSLDSAGNNKDSGNVVPAGAALVQHGGASHDEELP